MTMLGLRPRAKSDAAAADKPLKEARWGKPLVRGPLGTPRQPLWPKSVNAGSGLWPGPTPTPPSTPAVALRLAARLPDELVLEVLGHLDVDAYRALSLVNRGTYALLRSPDVERAIWSNTVGPPAPLAPPAPDAQGASGATPNPDGAHAPRDDGAQERTAGASVRRELTLTRSLRDAGPMAFAMPLPFGNGRSSCLLDADGGTLFWLEYSKVARLDLSAVARTQRRAEGPLNRPTPGPWQTMRHLPGPPARRAGPEPGMVFGQLLGATSALLHHSTGPEAYLATLQPTRSGVVAGAPLPLGAEIAQQLSRHNFLTLRERGFGVAPWKFGPLVGHSEAHGWHLFAPATGDVAVSLQPRGHALRPPSVVSQVGWMFAADLSTALCFADQAGRATLLRLDVAEGSSPHLLADYPHVEDAGLRHDGRWAFVYRPTVFSGLEFVPLAFGAGSGFRFPLDYATWQIRWSPRGDTLVTVGREGHVVRSYGFDPERGTLHLRTASRPYGRADHPGQLLIAPSGRRAAVVYASEDDAFASGEYVVVHGLVP